MTPEKEHLQRAVEAAEKNLQRAARLMEDEVSSPMWKARVGEGPGALLLRFYSPGVLSVACANTGQSLAVSEPGRPSVMKAGYVLENYRPSCLASQAQKGGGWQIGFLARLMARVVGGLRNHDRRPMALKKEHPLLTIEEGEKNLQRAATLLLDEVSSPLWSARVCSGPEALLLRFYLPGVLSVVCANTGQLLAVSEPGRPSVLKAGFVPENYRPAGGAQKDGGCK